jgi:hypothetical protein
MRVALVLLPVSLLVGCPQSLVGGACNDEALCPPKDEDVKEPPRLYVDPPFGVGFDCTQPGCDTTRTFLVENRGGGQVNLVLTRLSVTTTGEMSLSVHGTDGAPLVAPSASEPLRIKSGAAVELRVRYQPVDAATDAGNLWIDWYDGALAYEDAVVQRVELPLTTRVLGDPAAELVTPRLNFGFVAPGERLVLPLRIKNTTDGNAVLALEPPLFDPASDAHFALAEEPTGPVFVAPGETAEILIAFEPDVADAYGGVLLIGTNDGGRPQLVVELLGTAIQHPFFAVLRPDNWRLDFGEVRVGNEATRQVTIRNLGGQPLAVTPSMPVGAGLGFSTVVAMGQPLPSIAPLAEVTFEVVSAPLLGGELDGELRFSTNDPTLPEDWIDLHVYGVAPEGLATPGSIDFGQVVQSWTTEPRAVEITNNGTGELTITSVSFELGSSAQVRLAEQPSLPVKLLPGGESLRLTVFVLAQTLGPANAVLLVSTDGIEHPTVRVPVSAEVVSCADACPVANGTPTCAAGQCEVGSCLPRFHDADQRFSTGCECREDTVGPNVYEDISRFCTPQGHIGTLSDKCGSGNESWVTRVGTLHTLNDVDLYHFYAEDGGNAFCDSFGDSFHLRVQLVSAHPDVEFCILRLGENGACGGEITSAQCGLTSFSRSGSYGAADSTYVMVWVRRKPGAPPSCGDYSIRFRAQ